jgi:hypothetical protein
MLTKIDQWQEYMKIFNSEGIQTKERKEFIIKLFHEMLYEMVPDGNENDYREINIAGYNNYNGYSIVVSYDSLYWPNRQAFEISYSSKHVSAFKAYSDYIVNEYVYIEKEKYPIMYDNIMTAIKAIIGGKTGLRLV